MLKETFSLIWTPKTLTFPWKWTCPKILAFLCKWTCPTLLNSSSNYPISTFLLVLHPKSLVRAIGRVELSCPLNDVQQWYLWSNTYILTRLEFKTTLRAIGQELVYFWARSVMVFVHLGFRLPTTVWTVSRWNWKVLTMVQLSSVWNNALTIWTRHTCTLTRTESVRNVIHLVTSGKMDALY